MICERNVAIPELDYLHIPYTHATIAIWEKSIARSPNVIMDVGFLKSFKKCFIKFVVYIFQILQITILTSKIKIITNAIDLTIEREKNYQINLV